MKKLIYESKICHTLFSHQMTTFFHYYQNELEKGESSTLLVRTFGHVSHSIRAIIPSFQISYFSTYLLMSFSYFSFNLSVLMGRLQYNLVVDPSHEIPVSYCLFCGPLILFSKVSSASTISQSGSFALPVVMGCTTST